MTRPLTAPELAVLRAVSPVEGRSGRRISVIAFGRTTDAWARGEVRPVLEELWRKRLVVPGPRLTWLRTSAGTDLLAQMKEGVVAEGADLAALGEPT